MNRRYLSHHCELHSSSSIRCYLCITASVTLTGLIYLLHLWIDAPQFRMPYKAARPVPITNYRCTFCSWIKHCGMSRICFCPIFLQFVFACYLYGGGGGLENQAQLWNLNICVKESISAAVITYLVRSKGLNNLHRNVCIFHDFKSKYIFDLIRYLRFLHF